MTSFGRLAPLAPLALLPLLVALGCGDGKTVSALSPREQPGRSAAPPHAARAKSGGAAASPGAAATGGAATDGPGDAATDGATTDAAPSGARNAAPRAVTPEELDRYPWLEATSTIRALDDAIAPPRGFERVPVAAGSFGAFLRGLPLRDPGSAVHAHDGRVLLSGDDPRVSAVVALDPGKRDLQQCADTAIRLHAEWLWSRRRESEIGYHFTSGDLSTWAAYAAGDRPVVAARSVTWARRAAPSGGHDAFRAYLDQVFTYAGTVSLAREAKPVARADLRVGDVLVLPGGPGHTVIVLDVAVDGSGRRRGLLGQGFMPAQEAHVLASAPGRAWFDLDADDVDTPFWPAPFPWSSLRRMTTARGATE